MKRDAMWVLVIVVVVAIGAGLAGWWKQKTDRDNLTRCKSNLKILATAIEMYTSDNMGRSPLDLVKGPGSGPTTPLRLPQAVVPKYLTVIPTCRAAGTDTYTGSAWGACGPDAYTIVCGGHHHAGAGQGENYPQYTSFQGLISQ